MNKRNEISAQRKLALVGSILLGFLSGCIAPPEKVLEDRDESPPVKVENKPPEDYAQIYYHNPGMTNGSVEEVELGDAHVVTWAEMKRLSRKPTDSKNIFLFGGDHLFKVETSFKRALPEEYVVVREAVPKSQYFEAGDDYFKAFDWSAELYRDTGALMVFNFRRDLTHIIPLERPTRWNVRLGKENYIPLGAYLRRNGLEVAYNRKSPFKLFIGSHEENPAADGRLKLDIIMMNKSKYPITLYWPDSFEDMMRNADVYFDVYNEETELWETFNRPVERSALKTDYKKVMNRLSLSYEDVDLSPYFGLKELKGVFKIRLFMHLTQTQFIDPEAEGDPSVDPVSSGSYPHAWTGFVASNTIEIEL